MCERNTKLAVSCMPPTADVARKPGLCPDWESNKLPLGSQAFSPLSHASQG